MRLFIKQQVFSMKDRFSVKNEAEEDVYFVEGKFISVGKKLRIYDTAQNELVYIEQKLWKFLPEFDLFVGDNKVATVKKEFALMKNNYTISGQDWYIEGSVMAHDYVIKEGSRVIADINKKWFSWGDAYEIIIHEEKDLPILLGIVIVIDAVISQARSNASS